MGLEHTPVADPAGKRPHFNTGYHAHGCEHGNDGRAAVADEGEGQPHYRKEVEAHGHIDEDLHQQHPGKARRALRAYYKENRHGC